MTTPYWAERLRVRLIHELGGYTAEDVAKKIYEATRATPPCKSETFMVEEYQAVIRLGGNAFAPPDAELIDRVKDSALLDLARCRLKNSNAVQYCIIPWWDGGYALKATLRVAVPDAHEDK